MAQKVQEATTLNADTLVTFLGMTMGRRTRWNFLCEATNAGLVGLFIGIAGPFALPLAIRMGATPLEIALIASGPFIANLFSPLWATLSRSHRKVPWVVIPNIIWRGGLGLLGLTKNPHIMTGIITTGNLAAAAAQPAYGALVQKVFPAPIRGRLMGYIRVTLACVMLPTTLIAGQLLDRVGPFWLFLFAGLMGLVAIAVYALTKEPAPEAAAGAVAVPGTMEGLKMAFADPAFRRFLLAALLFHGGVLVANPLYAVFQVKEMGLTNSQISYLSLAWNFAWLSGFAFWGRMVDRRGAAFVVMAAAAFYLGLPLAYGLGGGAFAAVVAGHLLQGFADSAMDLGGWNMILAVNPERVGPYTSASMTMAGVRGVLGPLLGSWLLQSFGFRPTFLTAAVLVALGLTAFIRGQRIHKQAAR